MYKTQKGFTLVELVVVIVLLGILGVTALGKFQDLSLDAQNAANDGIASELSAASSINFAARTLNPANGFAINSATQDCNDAVIDSLFSTNARPTGYTWTGAADCTAVASFSCAIDNTLNAADTAGTATILCTQ